MLADPHADADTAQSRPGDGPMETQASALVPI
jgi:hypothetical protein